MRTIMEILLETTHRPYAYPDTKWLYYQEWNEVLFLHYETSLEILQELVPDELTIDTFNGKAYVSVVPFKMEKIRPRYLPSVKFVSNFGEINVRTYVEKDGKKGVYFLNIEAEKYISVFISKKLSGLPYEKSDIKMEGTHYQSQNLEKEFYLNTQFSIGKDLNDKSELDLWLTERYCLYIENKKDLYRYEIHHKEWALQGVDLNQLDLNYQIKNLYLN